MCSVCIERMKHSSSTIFAVCGMSSLTQARLWLVEAARIGLAIGLDLVGVSAPESMEQREAVG